VGRLKVRQIDEIAFTACRSLTGCGKFSCLHTQSDALGKQLVGIAGGILDEPVATPFLASQHVVAPGLSSPGPGASLPQAVCVACNRHCVQDSQLPEGGVRIEAGPVQNPGVSALAISAS